MAQGVGRTVRDCRSCVGNGALLNNKQQLQIFASGYLGFVARDMLGSLHESTTRKRFVIVIYDKPCKLTRASAPALTTIIKGACISVHNWTVRCKKSAYILTDYGTEFRSVFFIILCTRLKTKQLATTAYQPWANAKVERYNKTTVVQSYRRVAHRQRYTVIISAANLSVQHARKQVSQQYRFESSPVN